MNNNDIERTNILSEEELNNVAGGTGSVDGTKYHINDVFIYNNNTNQRYIIVGIGCVNADGNQKYILDYQEYQLIRTEPEERELELILSASNDRYAWVSLGLYEKYESFIDQFFTKI